MKALRKQLVILNQQYYSKDSFSLECSRGFSLIEILVSFALLGVLGAGVAAIFAGGNTALLKSKNTNRLEEIVDQDLAKIKDIAFRMTCCSGSCSTDTGLTPPCSTDPTTSTFYSPGDQNYYFPDSTLDTNSTAIQSFSDKCANAGLVPELIALIGTAGLPSGFTREFDSSQAESHRLTVTYSIDSESRSYTLVPTLSAWCP